MPEAYDFAVIGGGLAGLSLLYHFAEAGQLDDRRVALVDPSRKEGHDRSWAFWSDRPGPFDHLVHHRWDRLIVANATTLCPCDPAPFRYQLIRSTEFYRHVNECIDAVDGIERLTTTVAAVHSENGRYRLRLADGNELTADYLFDSRPFPIDHRSTEHPYLDQHFRGWFIRTAADVFDPGVAHLMDFRIPQREECRFVYVLPFGPREAMVEFTAFSNNHLSEAAYDRELSDYLSAHWTDDYEITHREGGNIPMTTTPHPLRDGNHIYIGLGGGAARPSTGYTFYGLQRQLQQLARDFPNLERLAPWPLRHRLYDATLLRILQEGQQSGAETFVQLFVHNPTERVLRFLNGETGLVDELRLMNTTNIPLFAKNFFREALNFMKS